MLTDTFKEQVLSSLNMVWEQTKKGKKVSNCINCLTRMKKQLETDSEPFLNYFATQAASRAHADRKEVYDFAKPHWQGMIENCLFKRLLN